MKVKHSIEVSGGIELPSYVCLVENAFAWLDQLVDLSCRRSWCWDEWQGFAAQVSLCGHATLASAHVLYHTGAVSKKDTIFFHTKGGLLSSRFVEPNESDPQSVGTKKSKEGLIDMSFPWITTTPSSDSDIKAISKTLSTAKSVSLGKAFNYLIVSPVHFCRIF